MGEWTYTCALFAVSLSNENMEEEEDADRSELLNLSGADSPAFAERGSRLLWNDMSLTRQNAALRLGFDDKS